MQHPSFILTINEYFLTFSFLLPGKPKASQTHSCKRYVLGHLHIMNTSVRYLSCTVCDLWLFSHILFPGDDSLRKSFDLFGEVDVNFHKRFFRLLGLNDNAIRSAEMTWCSPEDRVYELLKIWMEKEGMKADFNRLISDLHSLNQRLSAENITAKAIEFGYYRYEDDWKQAPDLLQWWVIYGLCKYYMYVFFFFFLFYAYTMGGLYMWVLFIIFALNVFYKIYKCNLYLNVFVKKKKNTSFFDFI